MSLRFPTLVGSLAAAALAVACSATTQDAVTSEGALAEPSFTPHRPADASSCPGTAVAGKLTLYLIPPGAPLDWSSPNKLIGTAVQSTISEGISKSLGLTAINHNIGHVNVELDCGENSIELTGQTGGEDEVKSSLDGFGVLLRPFAGSMNAFPGPGRDAMIEDIRLRQQNGLLTRMTFLVNEGTCKRVKSFHDEYVARGAYKRYGGDFRSRRFEGGGCGIFGADVVDVSGMLRRSQYAPVWTESMLVGNKRFANVSGGGAYPSGSNLVAKGPDGKSILWPHGKDIEAHGWLIPGDVKMKTWNGPEDDFQLPFSIYDPMLMAQWAERVWADASAHGTAESLEAKWSAGTVGRAHEITTDAHCTQTQTIPFAADNDDLFKDSDDPN